MNMNKLVIAALLTVCTSVVQAGPFKFKFNGESGPHSSTQRTTLVDDETGEIPEGGNGGGQGTTNVVNTGSSSTRQAAAQTVSEPATLALLLAIPAVMVLRRRSTQ